MLWRRQIAEVFLIMGSQDRQAQSPYFWNSASYLPFYPSGASWPYGWYLTESPSTSGRALQGPFLTDGALGLTIGSFGGGGKGTYLGIRTPGIADQGTGAPSPILTGTLRAGPEA